MLSSADAQFLMQQILFPSKERKASVGVLLRLTAGMCTGSGSSDAEQKSAQEDELKREDSDPIADLPPKPLHSKRPLIHLALLLCLASLGKGTPKTLVSSLQGWSAFTTFTLLFSRNHTMRSIFSVLFILKNLRCRLY